MSSAEERAALEAALAAAAGDAPGDAAAPMAWVARTGYNSLPWPQLRAAIRARLAALLGDGADVDEARRPRFLEGREVVFEDLAALDAAPFTVQRLCEVAVDPDAAQYRKEKLLWVVQKLVSVSTTLPAEPFPYEPGARVPSTVGPAGGLKESTLAVHPVAPAKPAAEPAATGDTDGAAEGEDAAKEEKKEEAAPAAAEEKVEEDAKKRKIEEEAAAPAEEGKKEGGPSPGDNSP